MKKINLHLPSVITVTALLNFCLLFILHLYFRISVVFTVGVMSFAITAYFIAGQYIKIPSVITLVFGSLLLEMVISPLRGYVGMGVSAISGFVAFLLFTNYLIKRYRQDHKPVIIILYIIAGLFILQVPVRIYDFKHTLGSFLDFAVHFLGIIAGYFFYERKRFLHKLNLSVSVLFVLFVYFYGYDLWMNKVNFGTFNGETHFKSPPVITLRGAANNLVPVQKGKLTVMDFWFLGCKSCFDEFPEFQKLYNGYKNNPRIQFFAINQPFRSDGDENCFKTVKSLGYTFPVTAANHDRSLTQSLQIAVYPTIVVMDTDGYIVYKGDIAGAENVIKSYMQVNND